MGADALPAPLLSAELYREMASSGLGGASQRRARRQRALRRPLADKRCAPLRAAACVALRMRLPRLSAL
jgi:hypothetical protein